MYDLTLIDIVKDNFPLILSTIVAIISVIVNAIVAIKQATSEKKLRSMDLYFNAQYEAYSALYEAAAELEFDLKPKEKRDIRKLIAAAKKAEMLSPELVVEVIEHFCAIYIDYIDKEDNKEKISSETEQDFKDALFMLNTYLRAELRRFNKIENKQIRKIEKRLYK